MKTLLSIILLFVSSFLFFLTLAFVMDGLIWIWKHYPDNITAALWGTGVFTVMTLYANNNGPSSNEN